MLTMSNRLTANKIIMVKWVPRLIDRVKKNEGIKYTHGLFTYTVWNTKRVLKSSHGRYINNQTLLSCCHQFRCMHGAYIVIPIQKQNLLSTVAYRLNNIYKVTMKTQNMFFNCSKHIFSFCYKKHVSAFDLIITSQNVECVETKRLKLNVNVPKGKL